MKVILLKDAKGIGKAGQVLEVADGYGRNFLIPRGLAKAATEGSLADLKHKQEIENKKKENELKQALELKAKLEQKGITLKVKAGDSGRLFGSVTSSDIADALKQHGFGVDKKKIELKDHIKELGTHTVTIKLYQGVTANLKVIVVEAS